MRILRHHRLDRPLRVGAAGRWIELLPRQGPAETEADHRPPLLSAILHAPIDVGTGPGGWSVLDARGFRAPVTGMGVIELRPVSDGGEAMLTVESRPYPGSLRLVPRTDAASDACDVVNHVSMERYLPGVLAHELYPHWRLHTHAAQAVAARSFACAERAFFAGRRDHDLTNTSASQMYGGGGAHERAVEAVAMTRGIVLVHDDRLVPGYYSSCCGGTAADARDAIGEHPFNDVPPLRGRSGTDVCSAAPLFSWTIERPVADLIQRIRAAGEARDDDALAQINRVRSIMITARNAHGRPRLFSLDDGRDADIELAAEDLRRIADTAVEGLDPPAKPLWSSSMEVTIRRRTARFDGHGHGHGAGLCQHGAEVLAQSGQEYESILSWYYPGVELVRAYL